MDMCTFYAKKSIAIQFIICCWNAWFSGLHHIKRVSQFNLKDASSPRIIFFFKRLRKLCVYPNNTGAYPYEISFKFMTQVEIICVGLGTNMMWHMRL